MAIGDHRPGGTNHRTRAQNHKANGCAQIRSEGSGILITECRFILVGIILTYSKELDVFRVDHIYKPDVVIEGAELVVRKGEDSKLLIPFAAIVKAFISIYGPQLRVGWHRDATHVEQWYLQLRKVGSPGWVGLDGSWTRWVER